jgi:hypothetical protein
MRYARTIASDKRQCNHSQFQTLTTEKGTKSTGWVRGEVTYATPICRWAAGEPRSAAAAPATQRNQNQPSEIEPQKQPNRTHPANRTPNPTGAHLAERVVLLLEPLEAALLRHGETLPPARPPAQTATAPAETLAQSSRPHAAAQLGIHTAPHGDPTLSNQTGNSLRRVRSGDRQSNRGQRGRGFGGIGRREGGGGRGGDRERIGGRVPRCEGRKQSQAKPTGGGLMGWGIFYSSNGFLMARDLLGDSCMVRRRPSGRYGRVCEGGRGWPG